MARPGLTYEAVKTAASALAARGETPTIQRIRDYLGSGSNTTIANHLKRWQADRADKTATTLPPGMPQALLPAVEAFWQNAAELAAASFDEERRQIGQTLEIAEKARLDAVLERERTERAVEELRAQQAQLADKMAQCEQALAKESAGRTDAQARLAELRTQSETQLAALGSERDRFYERLQYADQRLQTAQAALAETTREKDALQMDNARYAKRAEELEDKLAEIVPALQHSQQLLAEAGRQITGLETQISDARQDARQQKRALKAVNEQAAKQTQKLFELTALVDRQETQIVNLERAYQAEQKKASAGEEQRRKAFRLESQIAILQAERDQARLYAERLEEKLVNLVSKEKRSSDEA